MNNSVTTKLANSLNRTIKLGHFTSSVIKFVRAFLFSAAVISVWTIVNPNNSLEQLVLGVITFGLALAVRVREPRKKIEENDVVLRLEIDFPEVLPSPGSLREKDAIPENWLIPTKKVHNDLKRTELVRNLALVSTLVIPAIISFVTLPKTAPYISTALAEVSDAVASLNRGVHLTVIQGSAKELPEKTFKLSTSAPLDLELLSQNLVEVTLKGGGFGKVLPIVELRRPQKEQEEKPEGESVYQNFQMVPVRGKSDSEESTNRYSISFAASTNVELFIPAIDSNSPLARIVVKQLPVPKVKLSISGQIEEPWPDDQPLPLQINVKAENPLQLVRLLIRSGGRDNKETVATIIAEDKTSFSQSYRLLLEPYVQSDIAQVEIIAQAIDRSLPNPLLGQSAPLQISTASAYGRYRQTLQTLRELKTLVDDSISESKPSLPKEASDLASKASKQSERSPFFDGLDRVAIHKFERDVGEIEVKKDMVTLVELSNDLNDFLMEHEILDSRERDRDFFVAARGLSRLIEQKPEDRPVDVKTVTERLKDFIADRRKSWDIRANRLQQPSSQWQSIKQNKPFTKSMDKIASLDKNKSLKAQNEQLKELSSTVVGYRKWIEELEKQEDAERETQERKRQQGLSSARNVLRELQRRQGEVTKNLDRADLRKDEVANNWPSTRMKQNSNAEQTRRLENQMRSVSPSAAMRIKAAVGSMSKVVDSGNNDSFSEAESASDLSARLLRQAERAAQQSRQKRQSRGRRRRVTGDNYYGQSIVGGDVEIKREYQVDRRYREDILNDVLSAPTENSDKALLENYLRQVIR